jgi:hypothetical protein
VSSSFSDIARSTRPVASPFIRSWPIQNETQISQMIADENSSGIMFLVCDNPRHLRFTSSPRAAHRPAHSRDPCLRHADVKLAPNKAKSIIGYFLQKANLMGEEKRKRKKLV